MGAGCSWAAVVIVGAGCVGAGSLFADPGLWFVSGGARVRYTSSMGGRWLFVDGLFVDGLFVGGLFMDWVVVCGHGGAMSCVVCHGQQNWMG